MGVRCLKALISGGLDVPLIVTAADDPDETHWYASVAASARDYGIEVIAPEDPNTPQLLSRLAKIAPDFIFSFYYRAMLKAPLLATARAGALNMHGSLLPKFRGRAPVNWAILNGEHETGATLHYMVERADAGDIVDQLAVPILEDDDARCVFAKVTVAAETILARSLPALIAGDAPRQPQRIEPGKYFGRRTPADGRIDWHWPARRIHDLVRAVAPPFPGAFGEVAGERWEIHRTRLVAATPPALAPPQLYGSSGQCLIACVDGQVLRVLAAGDAHGALDLEALAGELARRPVALGE